MSTTTDEKAHHLALRTAERLKTGRSVTTDGVQRGAGPGMFTAAAAARHWKQLATQWRAAEKQPPVPAAGQQCFTVLGETIWLETLEAIRRLVVSEHHVLEAERVLSVQGVEDLSISLETAWPDVQPSESQVRPQEQDHLSATGQFSQSGVEMRTLRARIGERDKAPYATRTQTAHAEDSAEVNRLACLELLAATGCAGHETETSDCTPSRIAVNSSHESAAVKDG